MPDKVKLPRPALVMLTPDPLMMPVMLPAPLLVTDKALLAAKPMAVAVKVAVVIVKPVNWTPPIASTNTVSPAVLVLKFLAPDTVDLNHSLPLLVLLNVALSAKVIAPV